MSQLSQPCGYPFFWQDVQLAGWALLTLLSATWPVMV